MRNAERLECGILGFGEALVVNNEPASNEFRIPRSAFRVPHSASGIPNVPHSAIRNPQSLPPALVHQTEMCHISRHPQLLFYCLV